MSKNNNRKLSKWSGLNFLMSSPGHHIFSLSIRNIPSDRIAAILYRKIQQKRGDNISDNQFEQSLLLALFGLRGSPDLTTKLYAVDIPRDIQSSIYLDLVFKLLTNISDLNQLNLNFRELQNQFLSGKNQRNTQIRINLKWLSERLNYTILFNDYKTKILQNLHIQISAQDYRQSIEHGFVERLLLYKNTVIPELDQNNTSVRIQALRNKLGFSANEDLIEGSRRSSAIVKIARCLYPDECVCCKNDYNIHDRTFKKRNGEYYLEIHHVISFASDSLGDQIDNLVKLCPACHRALTKDRAPEDYQKQLIRNILNNSNNAYEYVKNINPNSSNISDDVDFVYSRLR